jgi:phosphopantetheine--protein transferase-like protein
MSCLAIGNDIVHVPRIRAALAKWGAGRFLQRILTGEEIEQMQSRLVLPDFAEHVAGRFACKEAVFKAVSSVYRLHWRDFSILKHCVNDGASIHVAWRCPKALDSLEGKFSVVATISHNGDYAYASALRYPAIFDKQF